MGRHVRDFSLGELKKYRPKLVRKPSDFDSFWYEQTKMNEINPKVTVK